MHKICKLLISRSKYGTKLVVLHYFSVTKSLFYDSWRTPQALPEAFDSYAYTVSLLFARLCEILKLVKLFAIQFSTKALSRLITFLPLPSNFLRDDTTSMKIVKFSKPPTSLVHLRPKFFLPLTLNVQYQANTPLLWKL